MAQVSIWQKQFPCGCTGAFPREGTEEEGEDFVFFASLPAVKRVCLGAELRMQLDAGGRHAASVERAHTRECAAHEAAREEVGSRPLGWLPELAVIGSFSACWDTPHTQRLFLLHV